ncbi:hypothetical protein BOX15_Mlig010209g1, partial [Macrostomum lignano]
PLEAFYWAVQLIGRLVGLVLLVATLLAVFNFSFGIRRLYIRILLHLFEQAVEKRRPPSRKESSDNLSRDNRLIQRHAKLTTEGIELLHADCASSDDPSKASTSSQKRPFHLSDLCVFVQSGIESIIEDEVTKRFAAEDLASWNLLTRTNKYQFISSRLTCYWVLGCFLRYCILFPFRMLLALTAVLYLVIGSLIIALLPWPGLRRYLNSILTPTAFRLFARAFSAVLRFHDVENMPQNNGICVANHTSPIDVVVLGCRQVFSIVGQSHGGFTGFMQKTLHRTSPHIWFERSESSDASVVKRKLEEHVSTPGLPPVLIFPEGTCINNTSVMMFRKGGFEAGGVVYPVAIKYDPRFADCFWNSSACGMVTYLFMMMTSWAIVADVWYLPPQIQQEGESSVAFANRVKRQIAGRGGLVDLQWDGNLKRSKPKSSLQEQHREAFRKRIYGLSVTDQMEGSGAG